MTKKNIEWVEFASKIVYIYEKLFNSDKEKLMSHFCNSDFTADKRAKKVRTINNWLNGKTKKPNKFYFHRFKISEYTMPDGSILLPHDAFEFWSFEKFKKRVDEYLLLQHNNSPLRDKMKYIYFFDIHNKKLGYFEIYFPNKDNNTTIHLSSPKYTDIMRYKGELKEYRNMFYLFLRNEFDHMVYFFDNIATVYNNKEVRVIGTGQSKDYNTRRPKAYLALLTSTKLSKEEEKQYAHKLNRSNLLIAKPFSRSNRLAQDYLIENLTYKIEMLGKDLYYYDAYKESSTSDPYYNLALQAYKPYVEVSKKVSHKEDYYVSSKQSAKKLIFQTFSSQDKSKIEILYTLTPSKIALLDIESPKFNEIIRQQIQLIKKGKLELTYLFVVIDRSSFNAKLIEKIEAIERENIKVRVIENRQVHYAEMILPSKRETAIYQKISDYENNIHITKHKKEITDLYLEYYKLYQKSKPLNDFLSQICQLNGKWYSYSYGSENDHKSYHKVDIEIKNRTIVGNLPTGINHGTVHKNGEYTLLLFDNTVIKIHNKELKKDIFRVSIIGEQRNIAQRDVLLFGLMSRKPLSESDVLSLLDSIHEKEPENFRLKISDGFISQLAEFIRLRI